MKMKQKFSVKSALMLSGIVVCTELLGSSTLTKERIQMADIEKAMEYYAMHHNAKLPASLDELFLFVSTHYKEKSLLKKEDLIDRWGEPLEYACSPNGRRYIIRSSGPDKKRGTADDILTGDIEAYQRGWTPKQSPSVEAQPVDKQETNAVHVVTHTSGAASPSPVKTSLWLYAGILLCLLCPILYFLRRKLKTKN